MPLRFALGGIISDDIIPYKQLSLNDIFADCQEKFENDKPLRDFCGFTKVPDASKITRSKQDFLDERQTVFDNLVDLAKSICQAIDAAKADMTIFKRRLLANEAPGDKHIFI